MKIKTRIFGLIITILAIAVVVLTAVVITSPWLYWYLLPSQDSETYKLGIYSSAINNNQIAQSFFDQLHSELPIRELAATSHYLTLRSAQDDQAAIFVPSLLHWNYAKNLLSSNGWHTSYVGPIVYAYKGDNSIPSLNWGHAIKQSLIMVFTNTARMYPAAIATVSAKAVDQHQPSFAITAFRQPSGLIFSFAPSLDKVLATKTLPEDSNKNTQNLKLSFGSEQYKYVSDTKSVFLNNYVNKALGIVLTRPNTIDMMLKNSSWLTITTDQSFITLKASKPSPDLLKFLNNYLSEEDAWHYPKKHYFKLPDGSLGAEMVPGTAQDVITTSDTSLGCKKVHSTFLKLNVCLDKDSLSITTLESISDIPVVSDQGIVDVEMPQKALQLLGITDTNYLHLNFNPILNAGTLFLQTVHN